MKKKKSLVGYARDDWKECFKSFYPDLTTLIIPQLKTKKHKEFNRKVCVTIKEL